MRWLQNRFGQQKSLVKYTTHEADHWHDWPQHLTAPLEKDFQRLPNSPTEVGDEYSFFRLGNRYLKIVCHPTFTLYVDDIHQLMFHSILFPSGAIWDTTLWHEPDISTWRRNAAPRDKHGVQSDS